MSRAAVHLLLAVLVALSLVPSARAEGVRELRFDPRIEGPLLAVGVGGWLVSEMLKPRIAPVECRFCSVSPFDAAGQRGLRWSNYDAARLASDALLFGVVPAATLGGTLALALRNSNANTAFVDVFIVVEALVFTAGVTQVVKYAAGRARPYVATQRLEGRDFVASPDDHLSFFSGHTSSTFALAVAAGTTATLRGYRQAPAMWAIGVPLAALTGYLRIAADRHYLRDVLTGALVGSAIGVLVPWLHARDRSASAPRMSVAPPATLGLTWVH